jgi:hypothetical protein
MTKQEQKIHRRLEIRCEELERANRRHMEVYREQSIEIVELRAALREVTELMGEAQFVAARVALG